MIITKPALEVSHLSKIYADGTPALHDVSFNVEQGDFFALLGPNGAGKSTSIGIISSLITPTSGHVKLFGYDLMREPQKAKSLIGLAPQEFNFNVFEKVINALSTQAGYYGLSKKKAHDRIEKYLNLLNLESVKDQKIRFLSGGMKRRLLIARALLHEPLLLILDEPTAGVDIELRRLLWHFFEALNREGKTVVLTTHYLEEAEQLCRSVGIIHQGHLIQCTSMQNLLSQLKTETFVLYLAKPLENPPELFLSCRWLNASTLEIDLEEDQLLSHVLEDLSKKNIIIKTMRNKVNRLEELFLRLTGTPNRSDA